MMPMSLGLGLGIVHGGAAREYPHQLFVNGEDGAWWDWSDLSTLFQDDAWTTPVTASGQTVGSVLDKSGNGNHLSQATAANRPLFTESGGLRYLTFDGANDCFSLTSMGAPTVFTALHATNRQSGTTGRSIGLATTGSNGPVAPFMFDTSGTFMGGHGAALLFGRVTANAPSGDTVVTGFWNGEWNTGTTISFDGVPGTVVSSAGGAASTFNQYGKRGSANANHRDYGFIIVHRQLTGNETSLAEKWLARKQGRTL